MGDLLSIHVREVQEAARRSPEMAQRKVALDSGHNVVVLPDKDKSEPDIVVRLREALIAEWRYLPQ